MADDIARPSWNELTEKLSQEIILGRRHPKERLIEDEVIAECGATRHAVRRAFDELERLGLALRLPNRGVRVRDYTAEEVEQLYEIRDALERRAAHHYTTPAPASLIEELSELAQRHADASTEGDMPAIFETNNAFHGRIYDAAGNPHLAAAIHHYTVMTHPIRTRAFPFAGQRRQAVAEHFDMIDAISKGDAQRLAGCISLHIAGPKEVFLESLTAS